MDGVDTLALIKMRNLIKIFFMKYAVIPFVSFTVFQRLMCMVFTWSFFIVQGISITSPTGK